MFIARVEAQINPVFVDKVDSLVSTKEKTTHPLVNSVDNTVDRKSDRLLSGADLARRLGVNPATLSKNRAKPNFTQWSQGKDPEQWAWQYVSELERYAPTMSTMLTMSTNN